MGVAVGLKSHCFKFRGVKRFWRRSSGDSRFSESPGGRDRFFENNTIREMDREMESEKESETRNGK